MSRRAGWVLARDMPTSAAAGAAALVGFSYVVAVRVMRHGPAGLSGRDGLSRIKRALQTVRVSTLNPPNLAFQSPRTGRRQ
jgi:hypothetical protein